MRLDEKTAVAETGALAALVTLLHYVNWSLGHRESSVLPENCKVLRCRVSALNFDGKHQRANPLAHNKFLDVVRIIR